MTTQGRFVTFEGLDGSGKSTQLARAAAWLAEQGRPVLATREPGGTPLGQAIRSVFLDPRFGEIDGTVELLLVFASRRQHLLETIDPALAHGKSVLCDRFTDSTLAYQGFGRGVDRGRIDAVDTLATGARRPDLTLLFDLPPEEAQRRGHAPDRDGGADRIDLESLAFYTRVREGFLALAHAEPTRFRILDATASADATEVAVQAALGAYLGISLSGKTA